ncbi:hypothetical protein BT96DRAFT_929096 [Gymnopus androsaceus JB14]|uniref:Uncharacterized protein n=1 Tax=Gymnopus androsaceus JB14 TaxID=1447944 RepID=A0A6A4GH49_9AGAR|nr:hypothetical protein BT96DRAFT_929096 [Gymnopus androsaceus JB14]
MELAHLSNTSIECREQCQNTVVKGEASMNSEGHGLICSLQRMMQMTTKKGGKETLNGSPLAVGSRCGAGMSFEHGSNLREFEGRNRGSLSIPVPLSRRTQQRT